MCYLIYVGYSVCYSCFGSSLGYLFWEIYFFMKYYIIVGEVLGDLYGSNLMKGFKVEDE